MRTITLAITTYNRYEFLIDCFLQVLDDERVSEIVIVDDASDKEIFDKVKSFCDQHPKIKLYYNISNQDCFRNKQIAVSYSSNPWAVIFDSDNVIDKKYIDRIFSIEEWSIYTIYQPVFAQPHFDFSEFSGMIVDKHNVGSLMDRKMFSTSLNAMNYFVNRDQYLEAWKDDIDPHTADSIYVNSCWLDEGNKIYYVPGLEYYHRVHGSSHYKNNNHKTGDLYQRIENHLRSMA